MLHFLVLDFSKKKNPISHSNTVNTPCAQLSPSLYRYHSAFLLVISELFESLYTYIKNTFRIIFLKKANYAIVLGFSSNNKFHHQGPFALKVTADTATVQDLSRQILPQNWSE